MLKKFKELISKFSWSGSYKEYYDKQNESSENNEANTDADEREEILVTYNGITFSAPKPISNEEYQAKRWKEIEWLEAHYDLSSAKGIASIPERDDLPRPTFGDSGAFRSYTGDIDYYLRRKSAEYEEAGNIELAILCLRKSNAIRMVSRRGYRKDDYYTLVRLLARNGFVEEAKTEKFRIDQFFGDNEIDCLFPSGRETANQILCDAQELGTDLVIMEAHGCACPECAKYQGRVFSLSGQSKTFPKIPDAFFVYGGIHKGCRHSFHPFVQEYTDPELNYTLQFYKGLNHRYRRNIIAFSNRPLVDDRAPEDIAAAEASHRKAEMEAAQKQLNYEHMIEREAQRGEDSRAYNWIQQNLPELCPKSLSGFRRMKNQKTKNFKKIVQAAAEKGYTIN